MSSYLNNLSSDQRRLLNMYVSQYDQTSAHIERLTIMLQEIRANIQDIVTQGQQHSNQSQSQRSNRPFFDTDELYYDFNRVNSRTSSRNNYRNNRYLDIPLSFTNTNTNRHNTNTNTNNTNFIDLLSHFFSTTVPVRPTQQQIQNASRTIRYGDINNPTSESCPISLERFDNDQIVQQLLPCEHIFETNGFNNWFANNVRCPVCRYDIRDYRPTNTNTSNTVNSNTNISNIPDTIINEPIVITNSTTSTTTNTNNSSPILTNDLLNQLMTGLTNSNSTDRIYYSPDGNYVLYETIIEPRTNSNGSNNNNGTRSRRSNN